MANMILIMIDECGSEVEVDRFDIGTDLDEDYITLWKSMKIEQAQERFPEARSFYFEDRRNWNSLINQMIHDFPEEEDEEWYEVDDEWTQNCPCDTYGPTACGTNCPRYFECCGA